MGDIEKAMEECSDTACLNYQKKDKKVCGECIEKKKKNQVQKSSLRKRFARIEEETKGNDMSNTIVDEPEPQ